jgi:hypothetical protein
MDGMFYVDNIKFPNIKIQNKFIKLRKIMSNYSIIVLRTNKNGELIGSKPCIECLSVLKLLNIKYVHYSMDDGSIDIERVKDVTSAHYCGYTRMVSRNITKKE